MVVEHLGELDVPFATWVDHIEEIEPGNLPRRRGITAGGCRSLLLLLLLLDLHMGVREVDEVTIGIALGAFLGKAEGVEAGQGHAIAISVD